MEILVSAGMIIFAIAFFMYIFWHQQYCFVMPRFH